MKKIMSAILLSLIALVTMKCNKEDPQQSSSTVPVSSVSLNKTTLNLIVGGTETLIATIVPDNATNKSVIWESSNSSIATVDANGKITAVKAGSAAIKVTTKDSHKTATCDLTVTQPNVNTPVSEVSLSSNTIKINLETGNTETLIATIIPANATNKAVTWNSSNTDIATVDANGKVTALKLGTTVVTVTTADGDKKASCYVYVEAWGTLAIGAGYLDLKWRLLSSGELIFEQGITIPDFGPNTAPWHKYRPFIKKVRINGLKKVGNYAFSRCTELTEVLFATVNGVFTESIGNYAFSGCVALRGVPMPGTVKYIGLESFSGCTSLQTIDMLSGLTSIGEWAFVNCISLQVIYIPNSVKSIGTGAFNNCIKLKDAIIGSGVTSIGEDAFRYCPNLKYVRCNALFPPALGARNFDAVGDELKVTYEAHDLYTLPSSVNGAAWRAAFANNIVY